MLDQRAFRDILGRFATGVVLVTARTRHGPAGMTVNAFMSVSLDPPLVALGAATSSVTWPAIRAVGGFAVAVLGDQHEELCRAFATRGAPRFAEPGEWASTGQGHPVPWDALAWLDCRITRIHPAGDHELVLAEALVGATSGTEPGHPLIFHAGRFTALAGQGGLLSASPLLARSPRSRT
jgi:3-hydroxy-9,10-secoandrosta-1,3,5(10)-triene-9,17-dione monooxygenase reductase component